MKQNRVLCCMNMAFTRYADGVVRVEMHRDETKGNVLATEVAELIRWLTTGSSVETPPHLRGPIIQAHADTNGVPPQSETPVDPTYQHEPHCAKLHGGLCNCNPTPLKIKGDDRG